MPMGPLPTWRLLAASLAFFASPQLLAAPGVGIEDNEPSDGRPYVACDEGFLVPYTERIPGTDTSFEMIPVEGGVVELSVAAEDGEPATCVVEMPPFWIGRTEVTWAEYRPYMDLDGRYAKLQQLATLRETQSAAVADATADTVHLAKAMDVSNAAAVDPSTIGVDAVTAPTPLYDPDTTYESGRDLDLPAVTMTPFAARQYTKWLASLTGREYRLPSEAEWLHAAGSETPADLDSVAWYTDNADFVAQKVGKKEPNQRGLLDTLGNVAEMVLDAYLDAGRPELAGKRLDWASAVAWPTAGDRRIAKGGWWDAEAEDVSAAGRMATEPRDWKESDPNLPKSPWWYADYPSSGVGFRLVRPLRPMTAEVKRRVWDTEDAKVARAVTERLREGRGKIGPIGSDLPAVLEELESTPVKKLLR